MDAGSISFALKSMALQHDKKEREHIFSSVRLQDLLRNECTCSPTEVGKCRQGSEKRASCTRSSFGSNCLGEGYDTSVTVYIVLVNSMGLNVRKSSLRKISVVI